MTDPKRLALLLNEFYVYTEPEIDSFEKAVDEFKERVAELASVRFCFVRAAHADFLE